MDATFRRLLLLNTDCLEREPLRDWNSEERVAIKAVSFIWTRDGTNVFLGWHSHQGGSQNSDETA